MKALAIADAALLTLLTKELTAIVLTLLASVVKDGLQMLKSVSRQSNTSPKGFILYLLKFVFSSF